MDLLKPDKWALESKRYPKYDNDVCAISLKNKKCGLINISVDSKGLGHSFQDE